MAGHTAAAAPQATALPPPHAATRSAGAHELAPHTMVIKYRNYKSTEKITLDCKQYREVSARYRTQAGRLGEDVRLEFDEQA